MESSELLLIQLSCTVFEYNSISLMDVETHSYRIRLSDKLYVFRKKKYRK